jgi:hypothetical protein
MDVALLKSTFAFCLTRVTNSQPLRALPNSVLHEFAITEFHFTLNSGTWDYSLWGYPF